MIPVTGDLETFWSTTHSLSKMNPFDYVMHPETEIISNSLKIGDGKSEVVFGEKNVRAQLAEVDWDNAMFIAHNMEGFDAMVYAWRLGIRPKLWVCTLAMARPLHGKTIGLSLAKLVEFYRPQLEAMGIHSVKDQTALINTRGKHLKDFTIYERRAMAVYNGHDTDQCYGIFRCMLPHYDSKELWHLDSKIRALVEPKLLVDVPLLEEAVARERQAKRQSLLALADMFREQVLPVDDGAPVSEDYLIERVRATLASAPMFCQVLESRGVAVPTKPSPTNPENRVPALAKTDEAFQALQEHDDPVVAAAAQARLSVKSTIAETRMQAFIDAAGYTGGHWPVTVKYAGADTTGRSSGWHYNPLNMPRINSKVPRNSDALRMCLTAPPGHVIVVADLSGIEMRFNHFLWRVPYSTAMWTEQPDADLYRAAYAIKLGITPEEVTQIQRQASKAENLALGFGMGPAKYVDTARIQGGLDLTLAQAEADVADWRNRHPEITRGWRTCHTALAWIFQGMERPIDPGGLFWTCAEGIRLPSGRLIRYPNLRREASARVDPDTGEVLGTDEEWVYGEGRNKARIYAGKVDENIVQAGARDVVYDVALDVFKATGHRPALEVYDELVYVVPESEGEKHLAVVQERMRQEVAWFPELVTWSEGDVGLRYGEVK